jgi:hypothetical protein
MAAGVGAAGAVAAAAVGGRPCSVVVGAPRTPSIPSWVRHKHVWLMRWPDKLITRCPVSACTSCECQASASLRPTMHARTCSTAALLGMQVVVGLGVSRRGSAPPGAAAQRPLPAPAPSPAAESYCFPPSRLSRPSPTPSLPPPSVLPPLTTSRRRHGRPIDDDDGGQCDADATGLHGHGEPGHGHARWAGRLGGGGGGRGAGAGRRAFLEGPCWALLGCDLHAAAASHLLAHTRSSSSSSANSGCHACQAPRAGLSWHIHTRSRPPTHTYTRARAPLAQAACPQWAAAPAWAPAAQWARRTAWARGARWARRDPLQAWALAPPSCRRSWLACRRSCWPA